MNFPEIFGEDHFILGPTLAVTSTYTIAIEKMYGFYWMGLASTTA